MRIEIPELKKCCCCVPLRRGLLFWVYLKLVIGIFMLVFFTNSILGFFSRRANVFHYVVASVALIVIFLEIIFCILFIISAHTKNHDHMRIYYRYAVGLLILEFIILLGCTGLEIYVAVISMPYTVFILEPMVQSIAFIFGQLVLQVYLVILVRSEMLKLERNTKFEFINHSSEPECKAQIIF